jgi:hypothetical protein
MVRITLLSCGGDPEAGRVVLGIGNRYPATVGEEDIVDARRMSQPHATEPAQGAGRQGIAKTIGACQRLFRGLRLFFGPLTRRAFAA